MARYFCSEEQDRALPPLDSVSSTLFPFQGDGTGEMMAQSSQDWAFQQVVRLELYAYYHHYCGVGSLEPVGGLPGRDSMARVLGCLPGPVVRLSCKRSEGVHS